MMFEATPLDPSGGQMLFDSPPQVPNVDHHGTTSVQDPNINHDVTQDLKVNHPPLELSSDDLASDEVPLNLDSILLAYVWNQVRSPNPEIKKKRKEKRKKEKKKWGYLLILTQIDGMLIDLTQPAGQSPSPTVMHTRYPEPFFSFF